MPDVLTQARLKELLHYNPDTGVFTWLQSRSVVKKGDVAGSTYGPGYQGIGIDGTVYLSHRLAFLYMTNVVPEHEVDHKNNRKTDNRWENLRQATRTQNLRNVGVRACSKSGIKGVRFIKKQGKWSARIRHNKKQIWLGVFDTCEQAANAYKNAAEKLHGEFANY